MAYDRRFNKRSLDIWKACWQLPSGDQVELFITPLLAQFIDYREIFGRRILYHIFIYLHLYLTPRINGYVVC